MYETEKKWTTVEDTLRVRYIKISKFFLVIAIIFILWVIAVGLGISMFELKPDWALATLDAWMNIMALVIGIFVLLDIIVYLHYSVVRKKRLEEERPKPEFIDGKRLYTYTYPQSSDGGIFSKTHIEIDDHSILRIRALLISPGEVWIKKE